MTDWEQQPGGRSEAGHRQGILGWRPAGYDGSPAVETCTMPLGLGAGRDGLVFVPPRAERNRPLPLLVMLHGAGASAADVMPMVAGCAAHHSVLVLAPDSRDRSWDMIHRGYGPDVAFLDRALDRLSQEHAVDPGQVAIGGFSDGASYGLSLGLLNGALFSDILAFSPGFAAPTRTEDRPRIFLSHGREDAVLPIDHCGRRVARQLARSGYDVDYHEFSGGHVVPTAMVEAAFRRFVG
jgi:phospholipase/carboxylesterase